MLLELPDRSVPFFVFNVIEESRKKGITPIIAHPERNDQIQMDRRIMKKLVNKGAMSQVTALSLTGAVGESF